MKRRYLRFLPLLLLASTLETTAAPNGADITKIADEILVKITQQRGLAEKQEIKRVLVKQEIVQQRLRDFLASLLTPARLEAERKLFVKLGLIPQEFDYLKYNRQMGEEAVSSFYDPRTKTVYIADEIGESNEAVLFVISLLFNLFQALQDQHFEANFLEVWNPENDDSTMARTAVIFGDALGTFLDLGLSTSGRSFTEVQGIDQLFRRSIEGRLGKQVPDFLKEVRVFSEVAGFGFIQFFRKWNSWEKVAKLYQDPPRSTEQILHPEKYVGRRDDPREIETGSPPPSLSPSWRRIYTNVMGEIGLFLALKAYLPEHRARFAAQGWDGDRTELYEHPDGRLAVRLRSVWDSAKDVGQFTRAYAALIESKYTEARLVPLGSGNENRGKELHWTDGRNQVTMRLDGDGVEIIELELPRTD